MYWLEKATVNNNYIFDVNASFNAFVEKRKQ